MSRNEKDIDAERGRFFALMDHLNINITEAARACDVRVDTLRIWLGLKKKTKEMTPHPSAFIVLELLCHIQEIADVTAMETISILDRGKD